MCACWDGGWVERPEDEREDEWEDSDDLEDDDAPWRGDLHRGGWPESLAGPEWKMYRDQLDEDGEG